MLEGDQQEREVRAARNQSMFRQVNEKLARLNEAVGALRDEYVIGCECADTTCIRTLEITADDYEAVRKEPNTFAVLPGHIYSDVEVVVRETENYVVVRKIAAAAEVAEALDPRSA